MFFSNSNIQRSENLNFEADLESGVQLDASLDINSYISLLESVVNSLLIWQISTKFVVELIT